MLILENLPDTTQYSEALAHCFSFNEKWMTTDCATHGGSDSFRVHAASSKELIRPIHINNQPAWAVSQIKKSAKSFPMKKEPTPYHGALNG
jgi:hypothetical protein